MSKTSSLEKASPFCYFTPSRAIEYTSMILLPVQRVNGGKFPISTIRVEIERVIEIPQAGLLVVTTKGLADFQEQPLKNIKGGL